MEPSAPNRRIPGLDGLRGVAVMLVLAVHIVGELPWGGTLRNVLLRLFAAGWVGVDLFFVLSGYLITRLLLDRRYGRRPLLHFYARRALRILPLYYLVVATLVIGSALAPHRPPAVDELLARQGWLWLHATNVVQALERRWVFDTPWYGASHFWSLAVEEQFYLFWPLLVLFLSPRVLLRACACILAASLLLRIACVAGGAAPIPIYVLTPTRLDALAAGALVAVASRDPAARRAAAGPARRVTSVGMLLLSGIFVARRGRFETSDPVVLTAGLSIAAWTFAALIAWIVAEPGGRVASFLDRRALVWLGRYSYGAYVVHWLVLPPLVGLAGPLVLRASLPGWLADATFIGLVLTVTALFAVALRRLWEEPFLRLRRYF